MGSIDVASYVIDDNILNVTLWLSKGKGDVSSFRSSFRDNPSPHIPIYGILIDIDSNRMTGRGGADYEASLMWNATSKSWIKLLKEITSSGHVKILNIETNVTKYYDEDRGYVVIPLNLTAINSPKQFLATFYIEDLISPYTVWDFTNWVNIPPPEYSISALPATVALRPGESKIIELKIDQIGLPPRVQPVVNFYPENQYRELISIDIRPNQTSIPFDDPATSLVQIDAFKEAQPHSYSIPIRANISFPSQYIGNPIQNMVSSANMTVTILPELTNAEQFNSFVNAWVTPIGAVWALLAGIGAVLIPVLIRAYKKGRKDDIGRGR